MTHPEFVAAFREGRIRVQIDPGAAGRYISAQLLLPLVMLPVLGGGVALALIGWIWSGLAVLAAGIVIPRVIRRSAPHFILSQAIDDERTYSEVTEAGVLRVQQVA
ncbi:MAG: hypothetical protein HY322_07930 [Betaproteobacteria bacterium]|nr:hypothetical protein [Betaproteobacteria bacterium]